MNLALAFGRTVDELEHAMSEREFGLWRRFANRYALPQRRIELHLAQIAMGIALSNGKKQVRLSEYLFDPRDDDDVPTADANIGAGVIQAMTSSRIRRLGQGRKKKD